jgi:hypothetical protein
MLTSNHPDDARLSALASEDADAVADGALTSHVEACERCSTTVDELGALRVHLAALPDVAPHRPLRLLPDAAAAPDRLGLWVRKVFGPVMAAGAALALVGMVGTVAPNLSSAAGSASEDAAAAASAERNVERSSLEPAQGGVENLYSDGVRTDSEPGGEAAAPDPDAAAEEFSALTDAERSPWPMVLFAGIAVLVAGAMLRWILVPRAG